MKSKENCIGTEPYSFICTWPTVTVFQRLVFKGVTETSRPHSLRYWVPAVSLLMLAHRHFLSILWRLRLGCKLLDHIKYCSSRETAVINMFKTAALVLPPDAIPKTLHFYSESCACSRRPVWKHGNLMKTFLTQEGKEKKVHEVESSIYLIYLTVSFLYGSSRD